MEPGGVTVSWGYDNAYRLTSEVRDVASVIAYRDTFTYDAAGNRTLLHNAAGRTTYTYDAANQLETAVLGAARTTYTYDNNGNLEVENASGTRTTHTWNDENQLTQVQKTGMTTNQYTFNGDGQRVQIVDSSGTKKPIWDFENILLETDGSNATIVVYTLEPAGFGNLISQRRSSTTSFYLFDALGSTRKLTSSAGSVTDSYDFRAYGETYASTEVTINVYRWVGELGYYLDIDRLSYYLRTRSYSIALARFLSGDPVGFVGSQWNLYEYAGCNPSMYLDPSGQASPKTKCASSRWPSRKPEQCTYGPKVLFEADFNLYDRDPRPNSCDCDPYVIIRGGGSGSRCAARVNWPLDCVCKNMPDDPPSNCVRGCLWCIFRSKGSAADLEEHEWCIEQCTSWWRGSKMYLELDVAIHCCARKQGVIIGPGGGKPPAPGGPKPPANVNCDKCGAGPTRPIDCSRY